MMLHHYLSLSVHNMSTYDILPLNSYRILVCSAARKSGLVRNQEDIDPELAYVPLENEFSIESEFQYECGRVRLKGGI